MVKYMEHKNIALDVMYGKWKNTLGDDKKKMAVRRVYRKSRNFRSTPRGEVTTEMKRR